MPPNSGAPWLSTTRRSHSGVACPVHGCPSRGRNVGRGVQQDEAGRTLGERRHEEIAIGPPSDAARMCGRSSPAASNTARMSSACSSKAPMGTSRSDMPMPRLSNTTTSRERRVRLAQRPNAWFLPADLDVLSARRYHQHRRTVPEVLVGDAHLAIPGVPDLGHPHGPISTQTYPGQRGQDRRRAWPSIRRTRAVFVGDEVICGFDAAVAGEGDHRDGVALDVHRPPGGRPARLAGAVGANFVSTPPARSPSATSTGSGGHRPPLPAGRPPAICAAPQRSNSAPAARSTPRR